MNDPLPFLSSVKNKRRKKKSRKKSNVHMSGKEVANVEKDALEGDGKFAKTFAKF